MKFPKPLLWMGGSRRRLSRFPKPVKEVLGYGRYLAQRGERHPAAKPLRGFGGAGVVEIVEVHDGNTYRAVYTVRFEQAVYVLHAFQKKSKRGVATPQLDLELIRLRLQAARRHAAQE